MRAMAMVLPNDQAVADVVAAVQTHFNLLAEAEVTLEANPGTAEAARFADYRAAGVNRLSIGVQSLADARLRVTGVSPRYWRWWPVRTESES